ncbi:hypothetical protein K2Z83_18050 [Oscillochloris sp. ZM17-4]|uniref:hypothetical protein n=1 Tax=Oscillochloris sp. ZM17-4 TaxID=2866714 RepID=UPI001C729FD9|nr:hypothetical protein [Oscillochloris sp. ZM17-4]MBX0329575.1 hypothetical protein [Oscillochloris sp. ZM17-4]
MTPNEDTCAAHETALVSKALGVSTSTDLAAHLAGCPACRRKLASYRQMRAGLLCGPFAAPDESIINRMIRVVAVRLSNARPRRRALQPLTR